ncbi:hypothetical protein QYE76_027366 [Lolium multiflorum]|uniref:Peptidase A1 domain-containing protein n=1 Tax=Lolium multiflorum TaxID=4521 RepID=A0AAD8VG06_LOLMU|nr:hypothetical protein QYE76_027366 [Lolium multiflorum]
MKHLLLAMQLLPCVLFLAIICAWPTTSATDATLRADLTHIDSGRGFTKRELLRRMAARSTARAASLQYSSSACTSHAVTVPVARGTTGKADYNSEYNIHFAIGTPTPQPVVATLDTGSDLIWTQCVCMSCFEQPFPVLDPSVSGTFRVMPCTDHLCEHGGLVVSGCNLKDKTCLYAYHYGDKSGTYGTMGQDTFVRPNTS